MGKLPLSFYRSNDVVEIARLLIGKYLISNIAGITTGGVICETEAYAGVVDKASHAFGNRRTERTEVMYSEGGVSYVYFTYGMHYLFNVVTAGIHVPHAVLIRGLIPIDGVGEQIKRRSKQEPLSRLTNGPAKVCQALAITKEHNGISLLSDKVWIEDRKGQVPTSEISAGPRIGVGYAAEDAALPYRFIWNRKDYKPVKYR